MKTKRNIAILAGGYTSEYEISMRSAANVAACMDKERYNVYLVRITENEWSAILENEKREPIDKNDFSFHHNGMSVKFDFAFIAIHGAPGEDGKLQGYLDMIGVPYSCSGVLTAALTYHKFACIQYLKAYGIRVADSLLIKQQQVKETGINTQEIAHIIGLPCFVKPALGGSSYGVSKVKKEEELLPAIEKAFEESTEVMVEGLLEGTEITCGCYKTATKTNLLPITEVVSHNEFFDTDAKYNGQVDEITPARLSEALTKRVHQLTEAIYNILDCQGIARIDYIVDQAQRINFLEANITPGMTETSFIPQQVNAAGLNMQDVITEIIEDHFNK